VSLAPAPEGAAGQALGSKVPRHVAIIMDGNGRWAERRGLPRAAGHRAGAEAVRKALQAAADAGVEVLTLYAFSSENWRRSGEEISDLTALMRFYLDREIKRLMDEGVKLKLIGDYSAVGPEMTERLERAVETTAGNRRLTLVVALNYGSRSEIAESARALAEKVAKGEINPSAIDEGAIADGLETRDLPDLDLLIRTSGEVRLSNFLLWQAAYAEYHFTSTLWPDFGGDELQEALDAYVTRRRRFGRR
jgi:undecaprenyl diphosphate synthase